MNTVRLSTKGQLIVPKDIRAARAWEPGTEFVVEDTRDGLLLRPVRSLPTSQLDDVVGCLKAAGKPKSIEQMRRAVDREVRRRRGRGRY